MKTDGIRVRSVRQVPQATMLQNTRRPEAATEEVRTAPVRPVRIPRSYDPAARKRNGFTIVLAVVAIALVAATPSMSTARITQSPAIVRESITPSFALSPNPDPLALTYETITVPVIKSVTSPYEYVQEAGGPARGTVRLFNDSGKSVALPTASRLVAPDGFVFITDGPVTVPGKTRSAPGSVSVRVSASTIGVAGNRDQEDFDNIQLPGGRQVNSMTGRTDSGGLSGGVDLGGPVVASDIQKELLERLRSQITMYELPENFVPNTFTTLSGGVAKSPERITVTLDPDIEGSARITLAQDLTYLLLPVQTLTDRILESLASGESAIPMHSKIPSFQGVIARISGNLVAASDQNLTLALQGTVPVSKEYDQTALAQMLAGKPIGEARSMGRTLPVPVTIRIFPPWAWKMPTNPEKITLTKVRTLD